MVEAVAVVAGYAALACWTYRSAVGRLTTHYFADGGDGAMFLWNYWAFNRSVSTMSDPFRSSSIFHPVGVDLAFHTSTPLPALTIGVARLVLPDPFATNVVLLLSLTLSGVLTYYLARREGGSGALAAFAGGAFVLLPWRYGRMFAHHSLVHTFVLPLGLLALERFIDRPRRGTATAFGLTMAAALWTDLTFFLFLLSASIVVLVWRHRVTFNRSTFAWLALAAAVAGAAGSPVLVATVRAIATDQLDPVPGWGGADIGSLDIVSYLIPPPWHPFGRHFAAVNERIVGGEKLGYVGAFVLAAAVLGAVAVLRRKRPVHFLVLALTFAVLSFGPFLRVAGSTGGRFELDGVRFTIPLPYLVLHYVPILNGLRVPARFSVVAALALVVVAAVGLTDLTRRWRFGPTLAGIVLSLLTIADLQQDWKYAPVLDPDVPQAYDVIATSDGPGAVLDLPLQWRDGFGAWGGAGADQSLLLYYATAHGRPVANGMVARLPQDRLDALLNEPLYRSVLQLQADLPDDGAAPFTVGHLRRAGIRWVVHHADRPAPRVVEHLRSLGLRVAADDGNTVVLEVPDR